MKDKKILEPKLVNEMIHMLDETQHDSGNHTLRDSLIKHYADLHELAVKLADAVENDLDNESSMESLRELRDALQQFRRAQGVKE